MGRLFLLALAGCYGPVLPTGAPCATSDDCPPPLVCDLGHCQRALSELDAPAVLDAPVVIDGNPGCTCASNTSIACGADPATTCSIRCVTEDSGARCAVLAPSNGVPEMVAGVTANVSIAGAATFDTSTGEITGSLTRAAGEGVDASGIGFAQRSFGTAQLGVFTFAELTVTTTGIVTFTGARAAVFVSHGGATIAGTIDASGGCTNDRSCGGPGGGTGGVMTPATGCGPGGQGQRDPDPDTGADGGGGGGGGGLVGGAGGDAGTFTGGGSGLACITAEAEPLVGGSGGGGGGAGATSSPRGGGGGGAFQLSASGDITITGTINAGGTGGGGGIGGNGNASAGSGGGAGGAILVEAPVTLANGSALAANGGGGGGGGVLGLDGSPGQDGASTAVPAPGGIGAGNSNAARGGAGGAGSQAAGSANDVANNVNAGGGGGGVGRIYVRAVERSLLGVTSPAAGTGPLRSL